MWAHGLIGMSTTAGVVVGAIPIPFADALLLSPLEVGMVQGLSQIYGINKGEGSRQMINSIVQAGTVGAVAKTAISALINRL